MGKNPGKEESSRRFSQFCYTRRRLGSTKQIQMSTNEDSANMLLSRKGNSKRMVEKVLGRPLIVYQRRKNVEKQVEKKLTYSSLLSEGRSKSFMTKVEELNGVNSNHLKWRIKKTRSLMYREKGKTSAYEQRGKSVNHRKQFTPKVALDERTLKEWENLKSCREIEEDDELERGWWHKEREFLHKRVMLFISNMRLTLGERKFSQWKGSVMDSVGGAFIAQNCDDTLSSSAFMSLVSKYPHGVSSGGNCATETSVGSTVINNKRKRKNKEDDPSQFETFKMQQGSKSDHRKECDKLDALNWEAIKMAKVGEIAEAIKIRGMSNNLSTRIKNCLKIVTEDFGSINLEQIRYDPPYKTKDYLLDIPGIGLKSMECIRLLTLLQKAFPIDINTGRVVVRLGWVPLKPLPEDQEFHLLKKYPKVDDVHLYLWTRLCEHDFSILYELHCLIITFAKVFCTKKKPNCNACPMKANCKHYASASAQLAFPGMKENNDTQSSSLVTNDKVPLPEYDPEVEIKMVNEPIGGNIEDFGVDGIPKKLKKNMQNFIKGKNIALPKCESSKPLLVLAREATSNPITKIGNISHLRREHQVYVLPDGHSVLAGVEAREGDSFPYLLAVWTPENLNKDEHTLEEEKDEDEMVDGTLLIPARTATRGRFPLNGTFFQDNEVFADDESSELPMKISWASLRGLTSKTLYCGSNLSSVCKGMSAHEVEKCFLEGFVCFRGFNRNTRESKPLSSRFHVSAKDKQRFRNRKHYAV